MISLDLAKRLRSAGLSWEPRPGDRFVVPDRDMDDEVFVISNMTVDVHDLPSGRVLGFNGTVEWALDSIEQQQVVWLPWEGQLRECLGSRFLRMECVPDGFVVVIEVDGIERRFIDIDAERTYARALLALLDEQTSQDPM